ncbi:MAG: Ada metal-binding domain-containing protein [Planctomycetota bacterium]
MAAGTKKVLLAVVLALFVCQVCTAQESKDEKLIGNKESKVYHKADCAAVKKMKEENKVEFASEEEAKKAEFKPCKKCVDVKKKEGKAKDKEKEE